MGPYELIRLLGAGDILASLLGRHTDAEAALAKMQAAAGNAMAYQYATIYAQWGNPAKALE